MSRKHLFFILAAMSLLALVLVAFSVPQVEASPVFQGEGCTDCHNDTDLITGIQANWGESMHANGEAFVRGTRGSCAGCHSGGGFSDMIAAGLTPDLVEEGDPHPSRQDCRACHQIHTTYTGDDFALETTDAVAFYAFEGVTYDGGKGNLCANCHQPRRGIAEADAEGNIEITSTHWGPHHGGQGAVVMGVAGAGEVEGSPSVHYSLVEDTCVGCHMAGQSHTFEASEDVCAECHTDEDFDPAVFQASVQEKLDTLEAELISLGLLDEEGHPAVQAVPAEQAGPLWNWIYIAHEDGSLGVHNPTYTMDLLDWSLESLGLTP